MRVGRDRRNGFAATLIDQLLRRHAVTHIGRASFGHQSHDARRPTSSATEPAQIRDGIRARKQFEMHAAHASTSLCEEGRLVHERASRCDASFEFHQFNLGSRAWKHTRSHETRVANLVNAARTNIA